jgi:predicted alpha-1,6-mannanase (GH76 family)
MFVGRWVERIGLKKDFVQRILIVGFCFAIVAASGGVARSQDKVGAGRVKYARAANEGVKTLQQWYAASTGLYAQPADWWNAANAMTVLVDYERLAGVREYDSVLANTFTKAQTKSANFVNSYYDDDGWWALAWIDAYDLTGEAKYLSMAESIFSTMTGGWEITTCGGGIWWSTDKRYKNAIANELFLAVGAELANRTKGAVSAEYLNWAEREWTWFKATGMINAQSLVNDGLTSTNPNACVNNGRRTWSYNQGVILGGLVELYKADKDPALLPQAEAIADAAIAQLVTADAVLTEPVPGKDAPQFKGIFMRNLAALYEAAPGEERARYQTFAERNAESILSRDAGPGGQYGGFWQGPFDSGDATRQTSALDALIAAAAMQ